MATLSNDSMMACHACDGLVKLPPSEPGMRFSCPRCGTRLLDVKLVRMDAVLALGLAALLLYIPANFLPIMTMGMLGQDNANNMVGGVIQLFEGGYWWMSVLVLFCSMVAPLARIVMLVLASLFYFRPRPKLLAICLVLNRQLAEWAMLDVYMLGILVAFIKMMSLGNLVVGAGLLCFVGMMVCAYRAQSLFDEHAGWQKVTQSE